MITLGQRFQGPTSGGGGGGGGGVKRLTAGGKTRVERGSIPTGQARDLDEKQSRNSGRTKAKSPENLDGSLEDETHTRLRRSR